MLRCSMCGVKIPGPERRCTECMKLYMREYRKRKKQSSIEPDPTVSASRKRVRVKKKPKPVCNQCGSPSLKKVDWRTWCMSCHTFQ